MIDLKTRKIAKQSKNGCKGSRESRSTMRAGSCFVGCDEGKLKIDLASGAQLGNATSNDGVDIIAFNPKLHHAYPPREESATMAIIGISSKRDAKVLQMVKTTRGAHWAAADDRNNVYLCDPSAGQLLVLKDRFPAAEFVTGLPARLSDMVLRTARHSIRRQARGECAVYR